MDGEQHSSSCSSSCPAAAALLGGELRAQHDVTSIDGGLGGIRPPTGSSSSIGKLITSVGGQVHPAHVQIRHGRGVEQHHRQFRTGDLTASVR